MSHDASRTRRSDPPEVKSPFGPGDIVAGKYRVEGVLGVGSMGVVLAATHVTLGQRVAIKFLHEETAKDSGMTERFLREAKNAVRLTSEHVARVLDVGSLDNGAPYMVMEYLEGNDMRAVAEAGATVPFLDAVVYLAQICDAVGEAHGLGIIHRDLKPDNLFMTRKTRGRVSIKVLDFGIAKTAPSMSSGDLSSLTRTRVMLGSPYYMSPEQLVSSRDVDVRTDVWALGVCLYQFVTGRVPYDGDTLLGLGLKVLHDPPAPPEEYRTDLPPELSAIIHRCLEKDRANRYANAGELGAALEQLVIAWSPSGGSQVADVGRSKASSSSSAPPPAAPRGLAEGTGTHEGRRPVVGVALGTFFGVLLIVGGVLYVARLRPWLTRRNAPAAERSAGPAVTVAVPLAQPETSASVLSPDSDASPFATPLPLPLPPSTGTGTTLEAPDRDN